MKKLIEIKNLRASYKTDEGDVSVLEEINLSVSTGESVGLIGESGSGKSSLSEAILKTLTHKGGKIDSGEIHYANDGFTVGKAITYIPQDPNSSLDPLCPIIQNFEEIRETHKQGKVELTSDRRTIKILEKMGHLTHGIDLHSFPHQLSGGMKQRVLIGLALQSIPDLIIADEPTSNLDVTLERKILEMFKELKDDLDVAFLLTTHNLSLAKFFCDRVYVLYRGKVVESGETKEVFNNPKHEYTRKLIHSVV